MCLQRSWQATPEGTAKCEWLWLCLNKEGSLPCSHLSASKVWSPETKCSIIIDGMVTTWKHGKVKIDPRNPERMRIKVGACVNNIKVLGCNVSCGPFWAVRGYNEDNVTIIDPKVLDHLFHGWCEEFGCVKAPTTGMGLRKVVPSPNMDTNKDGGIMVLTTDIHEVFSDNFSQAARRLI